MRFLLLLWLTATASSGLGFVAVGTRVPAMELPTPSGETRPLVDPDRTTVFLFFDPEKPHSLEALHEMAGVQARVGTEDVRWIGILSDRFDPAKAEEAVSGAGVRLQLLLDRNDALYGALEVRLYPTAGVIDPTGVLRAYVPYSSSNFAGALEAHLLHALGRLDDEGLEKALHPHAASVESDNGKARRHIKLAEMLWKVGRQDKAIEEARRAVENAPDMASAHAVLGDYLARTGRCEEARKALATALELDPGNERAKAAIERCDGDD